MNIKKMRAPPPLDKGKDGWSVLISRSVADSGAGCRQSPLRYDQWKIVFAEQREHVFDVWREPFMTPHLPKILNLRSDPFGNADHEGMDYGRWREDHLFLMVPAQDYVGKFLSTFKEFPPRPNNPDGFYQTAAGRADLDSACRWFGIDLRAPSLMFGSWDI